MLLLLLPLSLLFATAVLVAGVTCTVGRCRCGDCARHRLPLLTLLICIGPLQLLMLLLMLPRTDTCAAAAAAAVQSLEELYNNLVACNCQSPAGYLALQAVYCMTLMLVAWQQLENYNQACIYNVTAG